LTFKDELGSYSTDFSEVDIKTEYKDTVCDALTYGRTGNILSRYKEIQELKRDNVILIPEKTIDEEQLDSVLSDKTEDLVKAPVSSTMVRSDGNFVVYPSEKGLCLDNEKTIELVKNELSKCWSEKELSIDAVTKEVEPAYTEEDFYGVDSLLGRSVTEYNNRNSERISNLIVGTKKIADTVVLPGHQFSVYDAVAPFTEENGYQNAGQYINAELVDGLGGGICQVATTLYDAVLEAELQVDERYPHSMTVSYVDKGMDAAIAEGYQDFKFTNNTDYPIYIDAYAGGGSISVAIYGHETRPDSHRIEFESQIIETYEPGEEKTIYDDTLPEGTTNVTDAHTGYYVEVWKHIYENGELVDSVKVNGSQYNAVSKTTRIGTMKE
jgi:vancomycin resistance protein YoaR